MRVLVLLSLLSLTVAASVKEDQMRFRRNNLGIPQERIIDYKRVGEELHPVLINGEVLDRAQWKTVVDILTGGAGCTGTLVGPKVVLTAAHCGSDGETTQFRLHGSDTQLQGTFKKSPLYPQQDHDVAVAILSQAVPRETVGDFVSVSNTPLQEGSQIFLMGYGCTQPGGGGTDGELRGGLATVSGFSGFDVVSGDGAALCFGDSGGPGMVDADAESPQIITVNSKGNIRDTNYTVNLAATESQDFLRTVASESNVVICGITPNARECSNSPDPPDPPGPLVCDVPTRKRILLEVAHCFDIPVIVPLTR